MSRKKEIFWLANKAARRSLKCRNHPWTPALRPLVDVCMDAHLQLTLTSSISFMGIFWLANKAARRSLKCRNQPLDSRSKIPCGCLYGCPPSTDTYLLNILHGHLLAGQQGCSTLSEVQEPASGLPL
ncbi:hypothetical protein O0L34_g8498 [Tuta absoluta]|nr:hypothetical protein O0L34_g8498 [Tuta absoluta]